MKKKLLITCLTAFITIVALPSTVLANNSINQSCSIENTGDEISVRKADIRYQYKLINNVVYRRLYNFTTRKPVSDWEIAP